MILPHSVKYNTSDHKKKLFQLSDVVKLIFNNIQFVGQQVCKQSQTHACVANSSHINICSYFFVIRRYEVRRGVFDLRRSIDACMT